MNDMKRTLAFLIGCIGIRSLFVYLAKYHQSYLKYMGALAIIPAVGFSYIYLTGSRKTGAETGGKAIWWNDLRPIHAFNYFLFAFLAFKSPEMAYIPLLIDVIIGILAWIFYRVKC